MRGGRCARCCAWNASKATRLRNAGQRNKGEAMIAVEKWEHAGDLLPAYVNQTLDGPQAAAVRGHLASCPRCAAELAEWDAIGDAARGAAAAITAPSRGLLDRVWLAIEQRPE